jgi:hypothetical protein
MNNIDEKSTKDLGEVMVKISEAVKRLAFLGDIIKDNALNSQGIKDKTIDTASSNSFEKKDNQGKSQDEGKQDEKAPLYLETMRESLNRAIEGINALTTSLNEEKSEKDGEKGVFGKLLNDRGNIDNEGRVLGQFSHNGDNEKKDLTVAQSAISHKKED